jgi:hypothetical protein
MVRGHMPTETGFAAARGPCLGLIAALCLAASAVRADDTRNEFWPEVDGWISLTDRARIFLLATGAAASEDGYSEATFGVHLDYKLKPHPFHPFRRDKQLGEDRTGRMSARIGYRYGESFHDEGDDYQEQRILAELTGRWVPAGKWLVSDRNRGDFRWLHGEYSFRYRNRVRLEHTTTVAGYELIPYGTAELYYDTRYDRWKNITF